MPTDRKVLDALAEAVEASPDNVPLRLHYAGVLLEAERPMEALGQCQAALIVAPDDPNALALAARAARLAGDDRRAEAYDRLSNRSDTGPVPRGESTPPDANTVDADLPDASPALGDVVPIRVVGGSYTGDELHDVEVPRVRLVRRGWDGAGQTPP